MDYLPVFLGLRDRRCLVVGGGAVAARKVALLRRAGALVQVVAPTVCSELREQAGVELRQRGYESADLVGAVLVIVATDDRALNASVASDARAAGLPVNVVDDRELCTFVMPAIVDRSPVIAAVSSGGASPVLARLVRSQLERLLPAGFGRLASFASARRAAVKQRFGTVAARRDFWERVLTGPVAGLLLQGREAEAEREFTAALAAPRRARGEAVLIGAGRGDPELVSVRAARLLGSADLVLFEREATPVLELCRRDADRRDLGPAGRWDLESTLELIEARVAAGERVCLLRSGHPFAPENPAPEQERLGRASLPVRVC